MGSRKKGSFDAFKKFSSLDKRIRAHLPVVDCHHCYLHSFGTACLCERLGGNLQGIVPVFPNCFFPLRFPPSIIPNLRQPWFYHERKKRIFVQIRGKQELEIHPIKHRFFRPFQGIGIGLLFATKLLGILQIITGSNAKIPLFLSRSQYQPGRLLIATGITILVALLLSTVWTMDDLGIRYFNRKDYEIKMLGKYVGTLMPIVFGLYGVLSLFGQFSKVEALLYLFQVVVILYPPFAVFSVFHAHFLHTRVEDLSKRLNIEKSSILH